MTDKEINQSVAEARGWKFHPHEDCVRALGKWDICKKWCLDKDGNETVIRDVPDYCNDLNAMAEVEKTLPNEQIKRLYVDHLVCLMETGRFTVMATARQRAEAFLKTIGGWTE